MDRAAWVAETVNAAVDAVDGGHPDKADQILVHAVHRGLSPTELLVALTHHAPIDSVVDAPQERATPMLVTYVGPEPGVHLAPALGGTWMPRGEPVEVPDDLGRSLCEQITFTHPKRRRRTTAVAETPEAGPPVGEIPESVDPSVETR